MQVSVEGKWLSLRRGVLCGCSERGIERKTLQGGDCLQGRRYASGSDCACPHYYRDSHPDSCYCRHPRRAGPHPPFRRARHGRGRQEALPRRQGDHRPLHQNGFYYDFDVETPFSPDQSKPSKRKCSASLMPRFRSSGWIFPRPTPSSCSAIWASPTRSS